MIDTLVDPIDRLPGVAKEELRGLLNLIAGVCERKIPGAVIEMGCAQGHTTTYIRRLLNGIDPEREIHVADSFDGLPDKRPEDGNDDSFVRGTFAMGDDVLLGNFRSEGLEPPVIHRGWFGEITDYPEQVALAFLDGDFYDSIADSLRVLWDRIPSGGVVAVHDYHHTSLPGAKAAFHDFIDPLGIPLQWTGDEGLPYIIKP